MTKKRIRIDYTVYSPNYQLGDYCRDFRTLQRAMSAARGMGCRARIYRNFNQEYKTGKMVGDWWSCTFYWIWNGSSFTRKLDPSISSDEPSRIYLSAD